MRFNIREMFKKSKKGINRNELKECSATEIQEIVRGIFSVEGKLIAGAYYFDDKIRAIASDVGCVKLEKEPKLVEIMNINTAKIESSLINLKQNKVDNFILVKELC